MDTKWKKIRNNTMIKAATFLLACIFAFSTFYSASYILLFSVKNNGTVDFSQVFGDKEEPKYTDSKMFAKQFSKDTKIIKKMMTEYKSDENVKSGQAFKSKETKLLKEMEEDIAREIIERKKAVISNAEVMDDEGNRTFKFSDGETVSHYAPALYDDIADYDEGIKTIDGKQYYKGFPLDAIVVNEKEIRSDYEKSYKNRINRERLEYSAQYEKDKKTIEDFKNLKFAVLNKRTGEVFTNMGVEITAQTDFSSLIKGTGWGVAVQNGVLTGDKIELYKNNYYENGEGYNALTILSERFDNDGFYACFEINDSAKTIVKGDEYYNLHQDYSKSFAKLKGMGTVAVVSCVLMIACIVLSATLAGKVDEQGNTIKARTDWIYNDIHFGASAILALCFALVMVIIYDSFFWSYQLDAFEEQFMLLGGSACVAISVAFFVEWLMSVVRHSRCKTYWKHTLVYEMFVGSGRKLGTGFKKSYNSLRDLLLPPKTKNLKTRMFIIIGQYAGANMVLALVYSMLSKSRHSVLAFIVVVLMLGLNLSLVALAKSTIKALDDMMEALIEAEKGKFDFNLDVYFMPRYLQDFATHIVNLREGMKIAVDEAVKGERMKTELITNVSHDLKTPLTSIVNYVDLLKRCDLQDQTANSYIKILEEKAERLKRLIEDLVEASKISSGNVSLELTKVNLNELAIQLVGENEQELKELEIEMRVTTPSDAPIVKADSQKSYRAIENLFSNVKKYAMPKTRVYVDVFENEGFGVISIKNISKNELDVSVDQLTQRFVRGDEARATEGNGLGLSIADNLIDLQNGEFKIEIDGDLFKATVKLPLDK
ncbi:MAG: HAMP domain-containing sensor histidine kinase [Acutalibacteraceae bacterium]